MGREPPRSTVEPRSFEEGHIAEQGAAMSAEEEFWADPLRQGALGLILSHLVVYIDDWRDRAAVSMAVMEGLPYTEVAELLQRDLGYRPDPKTVWRWAQRGLAQVAQWVTETPWMAEMAPGLPVEHDPDQTPPSPLEDALTEPLDV